MSTKSKMARWCGLLTLLLAVRVSWADSGVLIPLDKQAPDPSILSLTEMQVDIRIDNGDARVWIRQIFTNHTGKIEEGNYVFALPSGTQVSDFAVWDGPVRIPAVILERKRAQALYQELKSQAIDPGLLQQGERTEDDAQRNSVFSAHIVPIAPWGTKRLEMEYHQRIGVDARKSYFVLPLKPDAYASQKVAHLTIHFEMHSEAPIKDFTLPGKQLALKMDAQDEHTARGTIEARDIDPAEDFAATWGVNTMGNSMQVIAYRDPHPQAEAPGIDPPPAAATPDTGKKKNKKKEAPAKSEAEPGYFEATAQLTAPTATQPNASAAPRTVVVLMDTSLSMQWEKLERSYAAAAKVLGGLRPQDRFNLLLFNTRVESFKPSPVAADQATVMAAVEWLRAAHLRGGTDLQKALGAGLQQATAPQSAMVLLTDGGADRGEIRNSKLAAWYTAEWQKIALDHRPKTDVFAVGEDANLPLLRMLSRDDGVLEHVLSSEPVDFKLTAFLNKTGQTPIGNLRLTISPQAAVDKVYALDDAVFDGGQAAWVGQYTKPQKKVDFRLDGDQQGQGVRTGAQTELPAEALEHDQLPRQWAWARVQALLEQIDREGETDSAIQEIIRLARKYKFVTPYTSFLAAPRALLRPRVIRPGDPLLRIHTDPAIVSVFALFPFGLEKPLRYLAGEDVWQTRFLAPEDMNDGVYQVRLILRDKDGQVYREQKSFVIASKPPTVKVKLAKTRYRAGEAIPLSVQASANTRTLTARVEGLAPVCLHWTRDQQASTGQLLLPAQMPAGDYVLAVTAEDVAHNLASAEVHIEVVP
ncbi:MAG TPA: VIT and VWA domain-containing protein [Terracidiphilus sp.]|jgi:Ca-activated chloride channel family protein